MLSGVGPGRSCSGRRREHDDGIIAERRHGFKGHVAGADAALDIAAGHVPWQPSHARTPVVEAPTAIAVFPAELTFVPRPAAERYYNLQRWSVMPAGGHFAAMEEPGLLVDDLRAFFRGLK